MDGALASPGNTCGQLGARTDMSWLLTPTPDSRDSCSRLHKFSRQLFTTKLSYEIATLRSRAGSEALQVVPPARDHLLYPSPTFM